MMSQGSRPDRVADQIRGELALLLAREVHDPGHRLRDADARAGDARPAAGARLLHRRSATTRPRTTSARALERAAPFLRRQIGSRLRLKRAPELTFVYDESIAGQDRIEQILNEIRADAAARRPPTHDDDNAPEHSARSSTRFAPRQRFVISSHSRPDGDSIGSQLAMAYALRALGKEVDVVNEDPAPGAAHGVSRRAGHRDRRRA